MPLRAVFAIAMLLFLTVPCHADLRSDLDRARDLLNERQFEQARRLAAAIVKAHGDSHEAHYYLGCAHLMLGHADDAIDELERATELADSVAKYFYWLSQAYGSKLSNAGRFTQMRLAPRYRDALVRTLELDPDHVDARAQLVGYCLEAPGFMGGGVERAREHAQQLVTRDERQGRLLLAQVHLAADQPARAEAEFQALEKEYGDDPDFFYMYNAYGYFLLGQGRHDEAVAKLRRQVELAPQQANPHDSLGEALRAAGRPQEALASYRKALEIAPELESARQAVKELEKELASKR